MVSCILILSLSVSPSLFTVHLPVHHDVVYLPLSLVILVLLLHLGRYGDAAS